MRYLLFTLVVVAAGCTNELPQGISEVPASYKTTADYKNLIVGYWGLSEDNGENVYEYARYTEDGKLHSRAPLPTMGLELNIYSSYEVKGNQICYEIVDAEPLKESVGATWCDEIVSAESNRMVFKDKEDGAMMYMYRQ